MTRDEPARTWICDGCGKRAPWGPGWAQLPGLNSVANVHDVTTMAYVMVTCSPKCEERALDVFVGKSPRARREARIG